MELTAATIATRLNKKLIDELKCRIDKVYFWTDSTTVLRYISNDATRFKTFVANRVSVIREATSVDQWNYISSKENPSDVASRGCSVKTLMNDNNWFKGPSFLQDDQSTWPSGKIPNNLDQDEISDSEIKRVVTVTVERESPIDKLVKHYSNWKCLVRAVALLRQCVRWCRNKLTSFTLTVENLEEAKSCIVKHEQLKFLGEIVEVCEQNNQEHKAKLLRSINVSKLDPYVANGVLRIGGRLRRADMCLDAKHQIILPKNSIISTLIVREAHARVGHLGKNATLSEVRKVFWIIGASNLIKSIISKCVVCRKYSATKLQQKMADLPAERLISGEAPFHRTGIDYFGPFEIKRARSVVKRYGVIFTCMNSRAVHLEIASSLDTDSCINAIRRFIARRSMPKFIRSDNGSNLVGANRELKLCIDKWNKDKLTKEFTQKGIRWEFNPPAASHFGGVWERLIRIVRKVLCSLQKDQISRLDDESLQTLMCEVEHILNNRPITKVAETPNDLDALSPNQLLCAGYKNLSYSPSATEKADSYIKRRWRQVQYLTDIFWKRWIHEYLPCLQERQKWLYPKRNVEIGDIVLVIDSNIRNSWALARVISVITDKGGLSRIATVKTKSGILQRPISKLCLVLECDEKL
ncbi:uncharacterized protein LOC126831000 [Patella vulgata]|uniref:uncharacterized protein LOC126831000 n=1 Tax=Patella vulgata TaxID=6465 RepID=UPI00218009B2|nr:uncharacterized protein LOC126829914 isoform X2 [Patella vulgata]XP_050417574.2 uncharacterized protein LOC126831000 [Patella vulgata]